MNDGSILSVVFVVNYYAEFTYPFSKSTEHTARTTRAEGFPVMIILDMTFRLMCAIVIWFDAETITCKNT